ncbi:type I-E CRISPR-associated protein Cas5/CasD [Streptomyces sp. NBC_01390]|uniref:type I-E CRISPR-associated protein Cas5/CasD n=1 Tax=Streptomyces sp. NBC_01390 TaxID=2903850 RepID=UPI00324F4C0C
MSGLLLRLAGPLQSWGERSAFAPTRDTTSFPTRSALIGMFCAAQGRPRDADDDTLARHAELEFTVRIDRPGIRLIDYHTVGGGQPKHLTAATSGGDHKGDAVITRRHYLADAVFTVAVSGPDDTITAIATALHQPHWAPYLGRRSCVPDEPFLLRTAVDDPVRELLERVPLSLPEAGDQGRAYRGGDVPVDFLWETYHQDQLPQDAVTLTVHDVPLSFAQHSRSHGKRLVHRTTEQLPATLRADQASLHQRLTDYAQEEFA